MLGIPWRFIGYATAVLAIGGSLAGIHHHGVVAGKTARDAYWQPIFQAAEKAAAEANARTSAIESAQTAATAEAEARHAKIVAEINTRTADEQRRIRALSVRLQANASACSGQVRPVPESASEPNVPTASDERAYRIADRIYSIGRACELDAAALGELQAWIRTQQALMGTP